MCIAFHMKSETLGHAVQSLIYLTPFKRLISLSRAVQLVFFLEIGSIKTAFIVILRAFSESGRSECARQLLHPGEIAGT